MKTKGVFKVLSSDAPGAGGALKARILEAARSLFIEDGFVRVRAEDIAARLGISKATLYREFPSKNAVLHAVVMGIVSEMGSAVEAIIRDDGRDFMGKTVALMDVVKSTIGHMRTPLGRDIEKYAPETWREIEAFRRKMILANFKTLIEAGVREGALRRDVDRDLVVQIWVSLVQGLLTPGMLLKLPGSADAVFEAMIRVVFEGLLTDEGRKRYAGRVDPPLVFKKEVLP